MDKRIRWTNFYEHQSDSRFIVYEFFHEHIADHFQNLLEDRQVEFERHLDESEGKSIILFGIEKRFMDKSDQANYLTHAHFRSPLIANPWLKWLLLIAVGAAVALGFIGYFKSN